MAELMTLEEVAAYLRVTKKTIYRMLEKQSIPSIRVGHQYRFQKDSIEAWLRQHSAGSAARILVVHDDEEVCSLFRDVLGTAGIEVTTAAHPARGVKLATGKGVFDMVFLPLATAGDEGAGWLGKLRAARPDLPVTIMTGRPNSRLMARAMKTGPFAVMKEPVTGDDILAIVKTYLQAPPQSHTAKRT